MDFAPSKPYIRFRKERDVWNNIDGLVVSGDVNVMFLCRMADSACDEALIYFILNSVRGATCRIWELWHVVSALWFFSSKSAMWIEHKGVVGSSMVLNIVEALLTRPGISDQCRCFLWRTQRLHMWSLSPLQSYWSRYYRSQFMWGSNATFTAL